MGVYRSKSGLRSLSKDQRDELAWHKGRIVSAERDTIVCHSRGRCYFSSRGTIVVRLCPYKTTGKKACVVAEFVACRAIKLLLANS